MNINTKTFNLITLVLLYILISASLFASEVDKDTVNQIDSDSISTTEALPSGSIDSEKRPFRYWLWDTEVEPYDAGWALYIDNDLLAYRSSDKDYTGGLSLTLAGRRAQEYPISLDPFLSKLNAWTNFQSRLKPSNQLFHSIEVGFTVFTPDEISDVNNQSNDRPYASLLYLSNTQESLDMTSNSAWISSVSLGVIGSKLVSEIQTELHKALGSDTPVGWDNQISNGGELTLKYSLAKQSLQSFNYDNDQKVEITGTTQLSLGYITQLSVGMSGRYGQFATPWYTFRPQLSDYSEKSSSHLSQTVPTDEFYFWSGFNVHLRAYNAFLQGQFKDSPITYSASEIRNVVAEGWIGLTKQFSSGWRLSYLIRGQTSEVKVGKADRSIFWGGLIISKSV